jgi:hypothetical protein
VVEVPPAFAPVVTAFARDRSVTRGKGWGAGNIVLTVNGKIFAMLVRGRFVAKLPRQRVAELVASGAGEYFDAGRGRPMKEWVSLGGSGRRWVELATEAHRFVKTGAS